GAYSVAAARKLLQLVKEGATVLLDPELNYHANGLKENNVTVRSVFRQLIEGKDIGKGNVVRLPLADSSLDALGITRDFSVDVANSLAYTHRVTDSADIYFITNQSAS